MRQSGTGEADLILSTVQQIHAAGLDGDEWPTALKGVTELIGGVGASLEVMRKPDAEVTSWQGYGLPGSEAYEYIRHYAPTCKRTLYGLRQKAGSIIHESLFTDEEQIRRDPFYAEFLTDCDMRYFIGASVRNDRRENVYIAVQRGLRQDHVAAREIAIYETLLPHVQLSFDVMRRLEASRDRSGSLSEALDWVEDGVLVLGPAGQVLQVNRAAEEILRRTDGMRVVSGVLDFTASEAQGAFLRGLRKLEAIASAPSAADGLDFPVRRPDDTAPYVVSLRPLPARMRNFALALMFVRDPQRSIPLAPDLLRRAFGLTAAEAGLAMALVEGLAPDAYALERGLSPNTVYTHLRAIKAKCGEGRLTALIRVLHTASTPVRPAASE